MENSAKEARKRRAKSKSHPKVAFALHLEARAGVEPAYTALQAAA
jgi:hypothetical protein